MRKSIRLGLGIGLGLLAGLLPPVAAFAQQPVVTLPAPRTTSGAPSSSTIASSNVWQQIWAATGPSPQGGPSRVGCTIINYGTHTMYVSEGTSLALANIANAVQLAAGQQYYCATSGVALQGQINIYGTAGDAFYAAQE